MRTWVLAACLLAPVAAAAAPCPTVMIVLDTSFSMNDPPDPASPGTASKLDIAKEAIDRLLTKWGTRMPFGLTTFSNPGSDCTAGIDVLVQPADGTAATIASRVAAVTAQNATNTGEAVSTVAALPSMHDAARPGSYILLITDGQPNCPQPATASEPGYTVSQIQAAATAGTKTFVIGFGQLPTADQQALDQMAAAGGQPCSGSACGGHQFYAADGDTALNAAIDAIAQSIVGEFGALCDDSCYANGCPTAGDLCVMGACVANPCANVTTCAPGDYCFTDGTSPGRCVHACPVCPKGQRCTSGACVADPCATLLCTEGQLCQAGACVADPCAALTCDPHLVCVAGKCIDDPCRFVTCPTGTTCLAGTGQCQTTPTPAPGHRTQPGGCGVAGGGGGLGPVLLVLFALTRRRRRASTQP